MADANRLARLNTNLLPYGYSMAAGIVLQTASHTMTQMVWGRIIAGIGNGGNTAVSEDLGLGGDV